MRSSIDVPRLRHLAEPLVERIAGAAHDADRIRGASTIERAAQPPDMHIDGALVDIDIATPHTIEQLLARIDAARALHQEFEQTEFRRSKMHLAPRARHALLLAVEFQIAGG